MKPHNFPLAKVAALGFSLVCLIGIWHRNYNLLGAFYDYSILTSAAGHLHSGLLPYRDFTTPLQSLTIWLCDLAELVFGRRYLALAYGNLVLGLTGCFLLMQSLKTGLSFYLRVLVVTALGLCTFFQHGIIWYNPVAMLLLSLTCVQAVKLLHAGEVAPVEIAKLCVLVWLSSMNKLNFHAVGLGVVFVMLGFRCRLHQTKPKLFLAWSVALLVSGIILGPLTEILLDRTTLQNFRENIFPVVGGRASALSFFLNPDLYFGKIYDFYPDDWSSGVYLIGFWLYLVCLGAVFLPGERGMAGTANGGKFPARLGALLLLPVFFLGSMLLTITNMEVEILTSSLLLAGLVCAYLSLTPWLSRQQCLVFQLAIFALSLFFLVNGGASAFLHSRVRYWESSWNHPVVAESSRHKKPPALNPVVSLFKAENLAPEFEPYFAGVQFTETSKNQLARVAAFMSRTHPGADVQDTYWGPGLEILNRVYGNRLKARLPLWYHLNVTVRDQDAPGIIQELERAKYEWIVVMPKAVSEMPFGMLVYVRNNYERVENDEIIVYHRAETK